MPLNFRFCGFENGSVTKGDVTVWCSLPSYGERIIDSYIALGESFLDSAPEDYSFVIFDRKSDFIGAFRDFFGLSPLFYAFLSASDEEILFIGFSIKSILDTWNRKAEINPERITLYFDRENRGGPVKDHTFFKEIYRILPSHALIVRQGAREWKMTGFLDVLKNKNLNYAELSDRFREAFENSVFRKSSGFRSIGANLSGGLDSSSVSAVAGSKSDIRTYYVNAGSKDASEEEFVDDMLLKWRKAGRHPAHFPVKPGMEFAGIIPTLIADIGQPEMMAIPVSFFEPMAEKASLNGSEIILSGNGGDQVVGYGFEYLEELFESENWKKLSVAIRQYLLHYEKQYSFLSAKWGKSAKRAKVRMFALYFFIGRWRKKKKLKDIFSSVFVLNKYFGIRAAEIFTLLKSRTSGKDKIPEPLSFIKPEFERQIGQKSVKSFDIEELVRHQVLSPRQEQQLRYCFSDPGVVHNEEMSALFSKRNILLDYPFYDRNVLEVALNVPLSDLFRQGRGRGILRDAMEDYLPLKIAQRTSKGEFSEYGFAAFKSLWEDFKMRPDAENHPVWDIVSHDAFDFSLEVIYNDDIKPRQKNKHIWQAGRVLYLAIWLDFVGKYNRRIDERFEFKE